MTGTVNVGLNSWFEEFACDHWNRRPVLNPQ